MPEAKIFTTLTCPLCDGACNTSSLVVCPACSADGPRGEINVPIALNGWIADERVLLLADTDEDAVELEAETLGNKHRFWIRDGRRSEGQVLLYPEEAAVLRDALNRFLTRQAMAAKPPEDLATKAQLIALIGPATKKGCFRADWWPSDWRTKSLDEIMALCDRTEETSCAHPEGAILSRMLQTLRTSRAARVQT